MIEAWLVGFVALGWYLYYRNPTIFLDLRYISKLIRTGETIVSASYSYVLASRHIFVIYRNKKFV